MLYLESQVLLVVKSKFYLTVTTATTMTKNRHQDCKLPVFKHGLLNLVETHLTFCKNILLTVHYGLESCWLY